MAGHEQKSISLLTLPLILLQSTAYATWRTKEVKDPNLAVPDSTVVSTSSRIPGRSSNSRRPPGTDQGIHGRRRREGRRVKPFEITAPFTSIGRTTKGRSSSSSTGRARAMSSRLSSGAKRADTILGLNRTG